MWKPGENDAEYIRLLKMANDEAHNILLRATGKLAKMAKTHAKVVHGKWVKMTGIMPPELTGHYECSRCLWHGKLMFERGQMTFSSILSGDTN